MTIVHGPKKSRSRPHRWPMPCCSFSDHSSILADLEHDALTDPDIAAILPRARYLLAGHTTEPEKVWWA